MRRWRWTGACSNGRRRRTTPLAVALAAVPLLLGAAFVPAFGAGDSSGALQQGLQSSPPQGSARPYFGFSYPAGYGGFVSAMTAGEQMSAIDPGSILRLGINWAQLQPRCTLRTAPGVCLGSPAAPDWAPLDAALEALGARGVRVLADVIDSPPWAWDMADCGLRCLGYLASGKADSFSMPPANDGKGLGYLAEFVRKFVSRYDSMLPGELVGLEVWSEENSYSFWPTIEGPDPSRYARLLCAASTGARSAGFHSPVLFGGLAYGRGLRRSGALSIPSYLERAYAAGAGNCISGVGVHSYPGVEPDVAASPFERTLSQVISTDRASGLAGMPVWITEIGYCTPGSRRCAVVSQEQQAYYLECAYQMSLGVPQVKAFIVNSLYDVAGSSQLYGVYSRPTVPKEAVSVLGALFRAYGQDVPAVRSCSESFRWPAGLL